AAAVGDAIIEVNPGQKIVLAADRVHYTVGDQLENVVSNGDFTAGLAGWEPWEDREQERPDVPGQLTVVDAPPADMCGHDCGAALQVSRESEIDAHNET